MLLDHLFNKRAYLPLFAANTVFERLNTNKYRLDILLDNTFWKWSYPCIFFNMFLDIISPETPLQRIDNVAFYVLDV